MALETGTYISDLNASNPVAGDPKSQGDDHIRLLKSTVKATFPNVAGAVTPTHTELNRLAGVTSSVQTQLDQAKLTSGTKQATTSGTNIDFTGIPSWVKRVTVNLAGVSTNGVSNLLLQIGSSGGIESSGYLGSIGAVANAAATAAANFSAGFTLTTSVAASSAVHGSVVLSLLDASTNTWAAFGNIGFSDIVFIGTIAGSKSLSGTLDRIRLTSVSGGTVFDAGSMNILYE